MTDLTCAECGTDREVKLYSPDMDIKPVPFCALCWWQIVSGDDDE